MGARWLEEGEGALHPLELPFKVFVSRHGARGQDSGPHARAAVLVAQVSLQPQPSHLLRRYYSLIEVLSVLGSQHTFQY